MEEICSTHVTESKLISRQFQNFQDAFPCELPPQLAELGIFGLVEDTDTIRAMWLDLKRNDGDPVLMENYETFLAKMAKDIQQKAAVQESLESRWAVQGEDILHSTWLFFRSKDVANNIT